MSNWSSQQFSKEAKDAGRDPAVIGNAVQIGNRIFSANPDIPIVFTLPHLAHLVDVSLIELREIVDRKTDPYRAFLLRKRSKPGGQAVPRRYRTICVPSPDLMKVQRWIDQRILSNVAPHQASTAYSSKASIVSAARQHCRCRWLIKLDIQRFFESISESQVYEIFRRLGYPDLLSFEFARICTRAPTKESLRWKFKRTKNYSAGVHLSKGIGFLPQGAPTSPKLANLAMMDFDSAISSLANKAGLIYSRYADDLIFSTSEISFSRLAAHGFIEEVYKLLLIYGFEPNRSKTSVAPPSARKIVLGLLVDQERPRLTRQFREKLETHVYYLSSPQHGPISHAANRGFDSVIGLQNHVKGLLAHAVRVDPDFASKLQQRLEMVQWPI